MQTLAKIKLNIPSRKSKKKVKNFSFRKIIENEKCDSHYIGMMNIKCKFCSALHFPKGDVNSISCCRAGKLSQIKLATYPEYLMKLLTSND